MPRGTQWHSAVPCRKYIWTLCRLGCGLPFDAAWPKNSISKLSVPSKEAARHMMSKGFQNGISQLKKKIRQSSPVAFHSFLNLKKVYKKLFFHMDTIALAAYAEQLVPRGKAAVCCILPCGIVWTHLYRVTIFWSLFSVTHKARYALFANNDKNWQKQQNSWKMWKCLKSDSLLFVDISNCEIFRN